jgi:hypothetical protein
VTTIAIDKFGTIAADGLYVWGGDIVSRTHKKIRFKHGRIYALTGLAPLFEPLMRWHGEQNADPDKVPKVSGDSASWTLIVIERPDAVTKYSSTCCYPETFPVPMAFGAGIDHAKGAMLFGATAEQAVRLVAENCEHTGGEIQVVDIAEALGVPKPDPVREAAE